MAAIIGYRDFDLALEAAGSGYRARVLASPAGEGSAGVVLPFGEPQVNDLLAFLRAAAGTAPAPGNDGLERIRSFGGGLFDAVFSGVVGDLLRASLNEATAAGAGIRLRLRLDPALTDIPWELLYNRALDRFLTLSAETPVVRYPEVPEPVFSAPAALPLAVLVMISSPADHPALDVEAEWNKLREALGGLVGAGAIALDRLDEATLPALQARLQAAPYQVFHFLGHGAFDPRNQEGVLLLEGPSGAGVVVPGHDLGVALHDAHLRLAVLNTCEGARGSARDPFAGTAQGLVQQGVPAVVAMQFEISDDAATTVAEEFYSALAMGFPVDAALAEARKAVYFTGNRVEWATPVLYLRAPDGRLFDIAGASPPVAVRAEVDPLAVGGAASTTPTGVVYAGEVVLALRDPAGAVAAPAGPAERPVPRLRRPPVDLRPKDFADLLGRDAVVAAAAWAFLDPKTPPVEITGPDGAGKTVLLRSLAHHPSAQLPDGVVYSNGAQPASDLLQFLFQTFYEAPAPVKPTDAEVRQYLHPVRALVELDDVRLSRDDVGLVVNVVPSSQFVLSSRERVLWEEGPAFPLGGLDEGSAFALIERRLGRALTAEEQPDARALVAAVGGLPLELVKAASRVRDEGAPLREVAAAAPSPPPPVVDAASLTGDEERVQAVLQAAGAPLSDDLLAAVAGLPDTAALDALEQRGVIASNSPRYGLTEAPPPALAAALDETPWPGRALELVVAWAEQRSDDHARILEEIDGLVGMLGWAERHGRWQEAVRLGRAIEGAVSEAGRWGRWEGILVSVLNAARALGDRTQEAWALHQLGTRALALGEAALAIQTLRQALEIREQIGDQHGAQLTRRNLDVAGGGGAPTGDGDGGGGGGQPPPRWWLRALIGGVVAGVAIAGALVLPDLIGGDDGGGVTPPEQAVARVDPDAVPFADQTERTVSDAATITVISDGDVPLEVGEPRLQGADPDEFPLGENTCRGVPLARGQQCTIQVAFAPGGAGPRSATLVIDTNAPGDSLSVALTGTGLSGGGGTTPPFARLELDPPTLDRFVKSGERRRLTILSTGTAPLQVLLSVSPDEEQPEFRLDEETGTCGTDVAPGTSCFVDVVFERLEGGTGLASLVVESNAGDPIVLQLAGTPEADVPAEAPFSVDRVATVTVTNVGTALLTVTGVSLGGDNPDAFEVSDNPCSSLVIDGSCTITITFTGDSTSRAILTVADDSTVGSHDVSLAFDVVD